MASLIPFPSLTIWFKIFYFIVIVVSFELIIILIYITKWFAKKIILFIAKRSHETINSTLSELKIFDTVGSVIVTILFACILIYFIKTDISNFCCFLTGQLLY